MAEIKLNLNKSNVSVSEKNTGTIVSLEEAISNTELNFNSRVLCKIALYFGIATSATIGTYEGREYINSEIGKQVNEWLEGL